MPTEIYLVKVGMNMTEGIVEEWYVPDGGEVATGELLYRLETEKVNLDVDAETSGTVRHMVAEGVTMEPGDVVGYIYAAGEAIPDALPTAGAPATGAAASTPPAMPSGAPAATAGRTGPLRASPVARRLAAESGLDLSGINGTGPTGRIIEADVVAAASAPPAAATEPDGTRRSSPMARKIARELSIDLALVTGTGPGGRITKEDVEAVAANASATSTQAASVESGPAATGAQQIPLKGMRKTIATRMHESLQTSAQLTMDMDVTMDDAVRLRNQLIDEWEPQGIRPTYTDLVIRAVAKALKKHPLMNSTLTETELHLLADVHVGMAVSLDDGLIVPVIHHADRLPMQALAEQTARVAAAAREGKLSLDDLQGGTFTVSTLGMFGVDSFTPIINLPQSGILGVNRIREDIAWEGSVPMKRQVMRLSLTWDHRALDGAPAAQFLAECRDLLEAPYRLLV